MRWKTTLYVTCELVVLYHVNCGVYMLFDGILVFADVVCMRMVFVVIPVLCVVTYRLFHTATYHLFHTAVFVSVLYVLVYCCV